MRKEIWGYSPDETLKNEELIREKYQGIRPAPGYPACPEHRKSDPLADAGCRKTYWYVSYSSYAIIGASVSGWYFSHPDSRYFAVAQIQADQRDSYADRRRLGCLKPKNGWHQI